MSQGLSDKANVFVNSLNETQRLKTVYPFDTAERYRFNYVPLDDRKGISVNELNNTQRSALWELLKCCINDETVKKVYAVMELENVLKELEHHPLNDHYRDPGKYFITIFGIPSAKTIWGWRFEGHHVSFHFSADKNELVAGTPAFLGSNPAVVTGGPLKGREVLKDETEKAFAFLHVLTNDELKKTLIDSVAPAEIITSNSRKAMIGNPAGIKYDQLSPVAQQLLLNLVDIYIHRYTKLFADSMLKEMQTAGLGNLRFAWCGATDHMPGKPYYYRIQGPTIIIEFDNTQNNANHIHTVVRDLNSDFGGDMLLEHYHQSH